jgi:hypothetical protein
MKVPSYLCETSAGLLAKSQMPMGRRKLIFFNEKKNYFYIFFRFMNITMEKAVYCDQKGNQYRMDNFMIRFRQILYIQIPNKIELNKAIQDYMQGMHQPHKPKNKKRTFKMKRALENNKKTVEENKV